MTVRQQFDRERADLDLRCYLAAHVGRSVLALPRLAWLRQQDGRTRSRAAVTTDEPQPQPARLELEDMLDGPARP